MEHFVSQAEDQIQHLVRLQADTYEQHDNMIIYLGEQPDSRESKWLPWICILMQMRPSCAREDNSGLLRFVLSQWFNRDVGSWTNESKETVPLWWHLSSMRQSMCSILYPRQTADPYQCVTQSAQMGQLEGNHFHRQISPSYYGLLCSLFVNNHYQFYFYFQANASSPL